MMEMLMIGKHTIFSWLSLPVATLWTLFWLRQMTRPDPNRTLADSRMLLTLVNIWAAAAMVVSAIIMRT